MHRLGSVQQRMKCVFKRDAIEEPSSKREGQPFQAIATRHVNRWALKSDIGSALATEKLDGTCCYVKEYEGQPYLWARLDKRTSSVPETWIPARSDKPDGLGWVPVEKGDKLSSVVNYDAGVAVVLRPCSSEDDEELLEIALVPLADLLGQTLELIGYGIQKNPYDVGKSVRLLVPHGAVRMRKPPPPPQDFQQLRAWFTDSPEGRAEGIVWHCRDGNMFKVHRPHMGLSWPLHGGDTRLGSRPVVVNVDAKGKLFPHQQQQQASKATSHEDMLAAFSKLNGQRFSRLQDVRIDHSQTLGQEQEGRDPVTTNGQVAT